MGQLLNEVPKEDKTIGHREAVSVHKVNLELAVSIFVIVGVHIVTKIIQGGDDLFKQIQAVQRRTHVVGGLGQIVAGANGRKAAVLIFF